MFNSSQTTQPHMSTRQNRATLSLWCIAAMMCFLLPSCTHYYEVGDYYRNGSIQGIVVEITDNGNPLRILSLEEAVGVGVDSALCWAANLNKGNTTGDASWQLPDNTLMKAMWKNKSIINQALEKHHQHPMFCATLWYWTSSDSDGNQMECRGTTPCTHVWACGPQGMRTYFRKNNSIYYCARAVRYLP